MFGQGNNMLNKSGGDAEENAVSYNNKLLAEKIDPEILENIRCSKCTNYFFSPIYLCIQSHNLCNYCKQELTYDPNVFGSASDSGQKSAFSSNFSGDQSRQNVFGFGTLGALADKKKIVSSVNYYCGKCNSFYPRNAENRSAAREKSAKFLIFPCRNGTNSCPYRNNLPQVEQHEQTCVYASRSCFFPTCEWRGATVSMITHLQEKHTFITLNHIESLTQGNNIYLLYFDSKFFLLRTSYAYPGSLKFSVFYPGEGKYKFEIYLMGYSRDIGISLTNYCEPLLNENVEESKHSSDDISIPFECLKHFIIDFEKLRFKLNIEKID